MGCSLHLFRTGKHTHTTHWANPLAAHFIDRGEHHILISTLQALIYTCSDKSPCPSYIFCVNLPLHKILVCKEQLALIWRAIFIDFFFYPPERNGISICFLLLLCHYQQKLLENGQDDSKAVQEYRYSYCFQFRKSYHIKLCQYKYALM